MYLGLGCENLSMYIYIYHRTWQQQPLGFEVSLDPEVHVVYMGSLHDCFLLLFSCAVVSRQQPATSRPATCCQLRSRRQSSVTMQQLSNLLSVANLSSVVSNLSSVAKSSSVVGNLLSVAKSSSVVSNLSLVAKSSVFCRQWSSVAQSSRSSVVSCEVVASVRQLCSLRQSSATSRQVSFMSHCGLINTYH